GWFVQPPRRSVRMLIEPPRPLPSEDASRHFIDGRGHPSLCQGGEIDWRSHCSYLKLAHAASTDASISITRSILTIVNDFATMPFAPAMRTTPPACSISPLTPMKTPIPALSVYCS